MNEKTRNLARELGDHLGSDARISGGGFDPIRFQQDFATAVRFMLGSALAHFVVPLPMREDYENPRARPIPAEGGIIREDDQEREWVTIQERRVSERRDLGLSVREQFSRLGQQRLGRRLGDRRKS